MMASGEDELLREHNAHFSCLERDRNDRQNVPCLVLIRIVPLLPQRSSGVRDGPE